MSFAKQLSPAASWEIVPGRGYQTLDLSAAFPTYKRAFLVRLPPGAAMHRHVDAGDVTTEHVVIVTNDKAVNCWVDSEGEHTMHMKEGARYLVDRKLEHWAENNGDTDRIHLLLES